MFRSQGSSRLSTLRAGALLFVVATLAACATATPPSGAGAPRLEAAPDRLKVLFMGDAGHHRPVERLRDLGTPMLNRGIELLYSEDLDDLNPEKLRGFDVVLLYANHEGDLAPAREAALLGYVEAGGGFVGVHSASGNFRTSSRFVEMLGGRFESHGEGEFRTRIAEPDHEIMRGFSGFTSWDETYVHANHNPRDRTVLEYREQEPYTWIRSHGQGRVFYTAWGHDERTWTNPGFHDLLERGIRWAAGQDVQRALAARPAQGPFRYAVLDVPFPPPHRERLAYERTEGPMDRRSNYPLFYDMQLAMSPEESMRRMILPPGFRVELFAAEPDIVNPIAMNWDERGRLWVLESVEYPYPREMWRDGGGKDRIVILEDTDGDGRADLVTEFASDLNIPTGLAFANGGVILAQAPQTLFLKDTTGDDRADVREVLFEGWSQRDTHAGPSNLLHGLDNWIWGVMGYSGFDGTVGGEKHAFSQGVYRFRPDGSELQFLRRTNNNTWGLGFNEQGGAFISTANGNPSTYLQFPRKAYSLLPEMSDPVTESLSPSARFIALSNEFRQVDWVAAYTAGAGHAVYTARTYPREYWNRIAFVTEATGHLVGEFILDPKGSTYAARHPRNLVTSDDQWFSPVMAEVGPDGHVWIADWYNYVIQHNAESDRQRPAPGNAYANPLRDRSHGRIYRIVYEGAPRAEPMTLAGAGAQRLVETMTHPNLLWRKHAQRLLVERAATDVVPALIRLVEDRTTDELGLNVGAIHAIWTLHGLRQLDGANEGALAAVTGALRHPSAGVRRNAVQALPRSAATADALLGGGLLRDADPEVRLQALVALAEVPESDAVGRAVFAALRNPEDAGDRWIREAGALAAAVHPRGFLAAAGDAGVRAPAVEPRNLIADPGFAALDGDRPAGWAPRSTAGAAELSLARGQGRDGGHALRIAAASGADADWLGPPVTLKPNTRYQIGAWIRTVGVDPATGRGVQISIEGMPPALSRTNPLGGTTDWTFRERTFTTMAGGSGRFAFTLGGGGASTGEALVDEVVLLELGPEPGQTLESIVELVGKRAPQPDPVPLPAVDDGVLVLDLGVLPDVLQFDRTELRASAGQRVRVVFTNTDHMEHNFVLIQPGSLERVGQLADQMVLSPQGRQQHYVPGIADVLASTPILEPSARFELEFVAPDRPGEYTFVCTIPGHWRVMHGVFVVEP